MFGRAISGRTGGEVDMVEAGPPVTVASGAETSAVSSGRTFLDRPGSRNVLIILGAVVIGRLACALAVLAFAPAGRNLATTVFGGDGLSYRDIAEHGYASSIAQVTVRTNEIAFFPLFPMLAGGIRWVTSLSFTLSATIVNLVASAVAAVLIAKVVDEARGPRSSPETGMMTAVLWVVQPWAFVLVLAYSEAVLVACAAGCLLALLRHRWLAAGLLGALAGATRSSGIVLVACCLVAAIPVCRKERTLVPLVAPVIAPLGTLAYFTYLRFHVGSFTAWFSVEHNGWHTSSDPAVDLVHRFAHYIWTLQLNPMLVGCYILVNVALLVLLIRDRNHPLLVVYAAGMLLFALANPAYPSSIPRFLLPAFPLLLPVIVRVQRIAPRYLVAAAIASAAVMGIVCVYMTAYSNVSV